MSKKNPKSRPTENPFDKFANSRKKHEILNRRVKGEDRNVSRARSKAVDERKTKLLQEYKARKKTNSFSDRRFGEDDAELSLEEKMLMRFQKEKIKKSRKASLFNLESEGGSYLTHQGKILADENMAEADWPSSDDEGLGKEVVNQLHFGGGLIAKESKNDKVAADDVRYRSEKADALQDLIMKSKLRKLEKKDVKDAQEASREKLDTDFQNLVMSSMLQFNPLRRDRSEMKNDVVIDENSAFKEYDEAYRAMLYESRVKATDRTKSDEEIAIESKKKLEELETARLRRLKAGSLHKEDEDAVEAALGSKGGRKRPRLTDDEIEGLDEETGYVRNEDVDGDGDGGEIIADWEEDADEENDDDDDDDVDDVDDDEDGVDEDDDWEDEEVFDGMQNSQLYKKKIGKNDEICNEEQDGTPEDSADVDNDDEVIEKRHATTKSVVHVDAIQGSAKVLQSLANEMPHKIECPTDLNSFEKLVRLYVTNSESFKSLLERICAWNSVFLPGEDGVSNRKTMAVFLDVVLLKYFVSVGDSLGSGDIGQQQESMAQLDVLTAVIYKLNSDLWISSTCASMWTRTIRSTHTQLVKRLKDYSSGDRFCCWPSLGKLLLFRLMGHVFSFTDYRHAIVTPVTLILCQSLSQCPLANTQDIASGFLCCAVLMELTKGTDKLLPEVLSFLQTIAALLNDDASVAVSTQLPTVNRQTLNWLRVSASGTSAAVSSGGLSWRWFGRVAHPEALETTEKVVFAHGVVVALHELATAVLSHYRTASALPEILAPLTSALRALRPHSSPALPVSLQSAHANLLESYVTSTASLYPRQPLQWRVVKKSVTKASSLEPRYSATYVPTKDLDTDKSRVHLKQLTRQLKREKKATMREISRDANFLDQEQYQEKLKKTERARADRHANFAFMEEQQATINQQVKSKGDKKVLKGGGSGAAKRSRIKR